MADTKVTALGSVTPVLTDVIYIVDDPGGTPASGKTDLTAVQTLFNASTSTLTNKTLDAGSASSATNTLRLRRDTAANWTSNDPTLALGEAGFETDTEYLKIGDGASAWTALPYVTVRAADIPEIDLLESDVAALQASQLDINDIDIYQRAFDTNANDARTVTGVTLDATDIVIWTGYSTRPTNMGVNDIWLGPPGEPVNAQTGTSYTLVLTDGGSAITMTNAGANTLNIPLNSSVAFPLGTAIVVVQGGAGSTTIDAATGVTLNGSDGATFALAEQYASVVLRKTGTDAWLASYMLSPADKAKLDGIEASADVTDATNVAAAGAVMDSDFGTNGFMRRTGAGTYDTDAEVLMADTTDQLTAGFTAAIDDDGTQSTGTYTPAAATGNFKTIVNGGAFTLAPPSPATGEAITLCVLIRNNASAGTVTTSGFTTVKGDSFTTTDGHEFICHIDVFDVGGTEWSALTVVALQ